MIELEYQRWKLIQKFLLLIKNFSKNRYQNYEFTNILERLLLSMANIQSSERKDPIFINLDISSPIYQKMISELEEKKFFENNQQREKIVNFIKYIIDLYLTEIDEIKKFPEGIIKLQENIFTYKKFQKKIPKKRLEVILEKLNSENIKKFEEQKKLIATLLLRYEGILSRGQQWNMPYINYRHLWNKYDTRIECFASPLNSQMLLINPKEGKFYSLFYDTDKYFGSLGNFFEIEIEEGTIMANPPYICDIMEKTIKKMLELLESAEENKKHLRIFYIMPYWKDWDLLQNLLKNKYKKYFEILEKNKHFFEESYSDSNNVRKIVSKFETIFIVLEINGIETNYKGIVDPMKI